jgi:hypothetical protein
MSSDDREEMRRRLIARRERDVEYEEIVLPKTHDYLQIGLLDKDTSWVVRIIAKDGTESTVALGVLDVGDIISLDRVGGSRTVRTCFDEEGWIVNVGGRDGVIVGASDFGKMKPGETVFHGEKKPIENSTEFLAVMTEAVEKSRREAESTGRIVADEKSEGVFEWADGREGEVK